MRNGARKHSGRNRGSKVLRNRIGKCVGQTNTERTGNQKPCGNGSVWVSNRLVAGVLIPYS